MKSVESSTVRFSEGPLANISNSSGLLKEDGKRVRPLGLQQDFHYTEEALPKLFQPFQTFFSHIVIKVTSYSYEVQIPSTFRLPANNYSPYHVASFKRQIHNAYSVHLQHLQYIYVTPAIHFHNTCTVQIKHLCPVIILLNTYKQNLSPPITTQPLVARSL